MSELYTCYMVTTSKASNKKFSLHTHNDYEIFFFLQGDAEYIIEEKKYLLSPGDMIIIKKQKMHKIHHLSDKKYQRLIINISPEFFVQNNCTQFEKIFLPSFLNTGEKISAEIVKKSGVYNALSRFIEYSNSCITPYTAISKSILIEILYLLNNISTFEEADATSKNMTDIVQYINANFTDKITLDFLCDKFYISKYYLCRSFKKVTGVTVQQYIKEKRLVKAIELRENGLLLTEAALLAGFENYSSFFRAFTQTTLKSSNLIIKPIKNTKPKTHKYPFHTLWRGYFLSVFIFSFVEYSINFLE